ncbi:ATP synthase gamma chain [Lachnospiraceae bacterium KM106-2]|nr:ATP synthase gamma chain [Lachnospiraceae bacterium KM106-2]
MANITEIRTRMKSIQDIMKITNAMYLISSSKLKRARKSLADTSPYFEQLQATIHDILLRAPHMHQKYFDKRKDIPEGERKVGYIVFTADKGLAGSFNHNVIKRAEEEMKKGENNYLFVVGQVGRQYFIRKGVNVDLEFMYTAQKPSMYRARKMTEVIIDLFEKEKLDDVYVIYSKMVTPMRSDVVVSKVLPLERNKFERRKAGYQHIKFDPTPEVVMDHLVPNYMKGLLYGILVESFSSEQNARMMAMEAATTSAKDMIKDLDLQYNRARQASITQEITEICSGAMSAKK